MKLLELINQFEKRNNLTIGVELFTDGSAIIKEVCNTDEIMKFNKISDLEKYLIETKYVMSPSGRCLKKLKIKEVKQISRCCGRCDGWYDICVSDQICEEHDIMGCENCFGKRSKET